MSFNTQPPEGGCFESEYRERQTAAVSTHSRPKAAAKIVGNILIVI